MVGLRIEMNAAMREWNVLQSVPRPAIKRNRLCRTKQLLTPKLNICGKYGVT